MIVYPYVTAKSQPATAYIHVTGEAQALEMPVRRHPLTGDIIRIPPLYSRDGETVFEVRTMPGRYELYKVVR